MSEDKQSIKEEKIEEVGQNLEIVDDKIKKLQEENSNLKEAKPYTYDGDNSWITYDNKGWIDFILHQLTPNNKVVNQYIIRPKMSYKNSTMDLADHYGIVLEITMD